MSTEHTDFYRKLGSMRIWKPSVLISPPDVQQNWYDAMRDEAKKTLISYMNEVYSNPNPRKTWHVVHIQSVTPTKFNDNNLK